MDKIFFSILAVLLSIRGMASSCRPHEGCFTVSEQQKTFDFIDLKLKEISKNKGGDQNLEDEVYIYEPQVKSDTSSLFIVGGMGPQAGLLAWKDAIYRFPGKQIILDQRCSIPDRTQAILAGANSSLTQEIIQKMKSSFELAAQFAEEGHKIDIFVSCNTAHYFIPLACQELSSSIRDKIEIHSLISSATKKAIKLHRYTIVLGTTGTIKAKLYKRALSSSGVEEQPLPQENQVALMHAIYEGIKSGDSNKALSFGKEALNGIILGKDIAFIAACTEVPLILSILNTNGFFDSRKTEVINPIAEVLESI